MWYGSIEDYTKTICEMNKKEYNNFATLIHEWI